MEKEDNKAVSGIKVLVLLRRGTSPYSAILCSCNSHNTDKTLIYFPKLLLATICNFFKSSFFFFLSQIVIGPYSTTNFLH